jgi:hypothetical protein
MLYSNLEWLVVEDMIKQNFDPNNKDDIIKYWSERLD